MRGPWKAFPLLPTLVLLFTDQSEAQSLASTLSPAESFCRPAVEYQNRLDRRLKESIEQAVSGATLPTETRADRERQFREAIPAALSLSPSDSMQFTPEQTRFIDSIRKTLRINPKYATDTISVTIFGDGNVKAAFADTTGATRASGALGVVRSTCRQDFTAQINIVATRDTLRGVYGASMLAPATGGFLEAGMVDIRVPNAWFLGQALGRWGPHGYLSVSSSIWEVADESVTEQFKVSTFGAGGSLSKQVLRNDFDGTFVTVVLDLGFAYRRLFGDLTHEDNQGFREAALNTDAKGFFGLETGLQIQVGQFKGALEFYYFGGNIKGFSKGQVVAGFSVQANMFNKRVPRSPRDWG